MDLLTLTSPHATATLSPYGGQVMSFIPHGQPDVLWQTSPTYLKQAQANGKALRGGIPICWPWFRNHPTVTGAPSHGLARTSLWQVLSHQSDHATLRFTTDATHPAFPYRAEAVLHITLTDQLQLSLTTTGHDTRPFAITQALHTYLRVNNLPDARIHGLEQSPALFITPNQSVPPLQHSLTVTGFHEHLYTKVPGRLQLTQSNAPTVTLHHTGTTEAVVWNPGPDAARTLDLPPGDEQHFLCLEAANITTAPTLQPGQSATLAANLAPTITH